MKAEKQSPLIKTPTLPAAAKKPTFSMPSALSRIVKCSIQGGEDSDKALQCFIEITSEATQQESSKLIKALEEAEIDVSSIKKYYADKFKEAPAIRSTARELKPFVTRALPKYNPKNGNAMLQNVIIPAKWGEEEVQEIMVGNFVKGTNGAIILQIMTQKTASELGIEYPTELPPSKRPRKGSTVITEAATAKAYAELDAQNENSPKSNDDLEDFFK